MLDYNPQPLPVLKERFMRSMVKIYSTASISENVNDRPGNKPENIFDFEDGIRLIVSRDIVYNKEVIHFSGSINVQLFKGRADKSLMQKMVDHFGELMDSPVTCKFSGFSKGGIPHWYIEQSNLN